MKKKLLGCNDLREFSFLLHKVFKKTFPHGRKKPESNRKFGSTVMIQRSYFRNGENDPFCENEGRKLMTIRKKNAFQRSHSKMEE